MKRYDAIFWRSANGGFYTGMTIEAESKEEAEKKACEYIKACGDPAELRKLTEQEQTPEQEQEEEE